MNNALPNGLVYQYVLLKFKDQKISDQSLKISKGISINFKSYGLTKSLIKVELGI